MRFKLFVVYLTAIFVPLSFFGATGCKPTGEEPQGGGVGIEGPTQQPPPTQAPESTQTEGGAGATAPGEVTFSPNCLAANVASFNTSANNRILYSSIKEPPAFLDAICSGSSSSGTIVTAIATFLDDAQQQTLKEISVTGIALPSGLSCPDYITYRSWAFHYHASLDIGGQTIALGRLVRDSVDPTRYTINPNFTAALQGAILNIKAVQHTADDFDSGHFTCTIPPNSSYSLVKDAGGGNQIESHTLFSGGITVP